MFWQWASIETYMYVIRLHHVNFPVLRNLKPRAHVIMTRKRELICRSIRRRREGTGKERLCSLLRGKYKVNVKSLFLCAGQLKL